MDTPEVMQDMVDMDVAMQAIVVTDMERGLLMPKLLLSQDMDTPEVMVDMDMERGLLMPKLLLKLMLSQDMEDMVDMAVAMEVMVVMDMQRGLLKLMLRLDTVEDMVAEEDLV